MTSMTPDLDAAERFLAASGRVVERRVFDRLFAGGPPEPVRDAVAAYRNPDEGWTFNWLARSPAAEHDWRGIVTIEGLATLRANSRL